MSHHWNWRFLFFALLFIGDRVKGQKGATLHFEKLKSPILLFKIPILIRNVGPIHCKWWDLYFFLYNMLYFIQTSYMHAFSFVCLCYFPVTLLIAFYSFIKQESRKEQIVYIFIISGRSGCTNLRPVFQFC